MPYLSKQGAGAHEDLSAQGKASIRASGVAALLAVHLHRRGEAIWSLLAEAALLEADRHKDRFLAMLAHELRNGLSPLVYNVQIANLHADNPARSKELFVRSERQLQHLVRLVNDLLDVARISTGKIRLKLEPVAIVS